MEKRIILFPIAFLFIMTLVDIVIVETLFRPTQAWQDIWIWHYFYVPLQFIIPLLVAWYFKSMIPTSALLFWHFGIEDTLFYAAQGYLPEKYWGVEMLGLYEPSLIQGLIINSFGIILILSYAFIVFRYQSCLIKRLRII